MLTSAVVERRMHGLVDKKTSALPEPKNIENQDN